MHTEVTTGELLVEGIRRLMGYCETPQLDAELLLAHVLGIGRARLRSHPEVGQSTEHADTYRSLIDRRVLGEPLAYIVGHKDFWTLTLAVSPAVLVPRPETELIVERALQLLADRAASSAAADGPAGAHAPKRGVGSVRNSAGDAGSDRPRAASGATRSGPTGSPSVHIADLGTGSGAIALALASERPSWQVTATDVSPEALAIAGANASSLQLNNVRFFEGRWLLPLVGMRFDLIASNPPYIQANDAALSAPALRYEPQIALTPGLDALADLREIIRRAPDHLEPGGWLLLEHGNDQAAAVAHELVARGFTHVRCHPDLAGHDRMTEAQWAAQWVE